MVRVTIRNQSNKFYAIFWTIQKVESTFQEHPDNCLVIAECLLLLLATKQGNINVGGVEHHSHLADTWHFQQTGISLPQGIDSYIHDLKIRFRFLIPFSSTEFSKMYLMSRNSVLIYYGRNIVYKIILRIIFSNFVSK